MPNAQVTHAGIGNRRLLSRVAGDWITMRSNLWTDPSVATCDLSGCAETTVISGLFGRGPPPASTNMVLLRLRRA